ncbi:MAG: hypothetical protein ACK4PR_07890, partial [Gammaproteobacteria bacterium]
LAGKASCVLSLQINGSQITPGNTNGPVVCEQGNSLQCYRPSAADTLNVSISTASYTVGGNISGLSGTVVLLNNGSDDSINTTDGAFTFSSPLANGNTYNVTVGTQPAGQTCNVINGSGVISNSNVSNVVVTCSSNAYTVGGTISGLSGTVVLLNNGSDASTNSSNGPFTFSTPVAEGSPYNVTVGTQPSGQTCTVTNGSGIMGSSNVTNVFVTCTPDSTTLAISVSNLALSQTGYTEYGVSGTPSSGVARTITITNTGANTATNLSINYPTWPTGTTASSDCSSTLSSSSSCTITITPGNTATSDGSNPCTSGTAPIPQTITINADNASTVSTDVVILGYGCVYSGGYIYSLDDTTSATSNVAGKVVTTTNQSSGIIWSSNSSGTYDGGIAIYGISDTSTTLSPNPSSGQVAGQTACNGSTDGACDTNNIYVYYQNNATGAPINTSFYAAGLCKETISGYSDWYLPALCEMGYGASCGSSSTPTTQNIQSNLVDYNSLNLLAGAYWSSTEFSALPTGLARSQFFASGGGSLQLANGKGSTFPVRCSRVF